jgi:glutamate synthase domain-containing protein 3
VADILSGVRVGSWVVFRDQDGMRHAVKQGAVLAISEGDGDVTTLQMTGGRTALVRQAFEKVLSWFR